MSAENVEIVRRVLTAFLSKPPDLETLREVTDADTVMTSNWGVGETEHRGLPGALATLADMSDTWDSWEQEIEGILDAGEGGVVALMRFRGRGRGSAVPVEAPWAVVATLRDGKLVAARTFLTHDEALKAAGLQD